MIANAPLFFATTPVHRRIHDREGTQAPGEVAVAGTAWRSVTIRRVRPSSGAETANDRGPTLHNPCSARCREGEFDVEFVRRSRVAVRA